MIVSQNILKIMLVVLIRVLQIVIAEMNVIHIQLLISIKTNIKNVLSTADSRKAEVKIVLNNVRKAMNSLFKFNNKMFKN